MGLGTITLLGMLCTPGQVPADVTTWNNSSMKIPIDYHPSKKGEIRELLLYVSADQGQTWIQHAVAVPDRDTFFTYAAPADGTYWFNMVVIDKTGRRDPENINKAAPALKVLFDTKKPVVNIASAQRVGEDITVVWKVVEKNPDWSKFKLEYSSNGTNWTPVSTRPEADGSAQFKVAGGALLTVRLTMTDVVGHTADASSPVAGTAIVAKPIGESPSGIVATGGQTEIPPPVAGGPTPAPGVVVPPPQPGATNDRLKDPSLPTENRGTDTRPPEAFPPPPGTPGAPKIPSPEPSLSSPPALAPKSDPVSVNTTAASNLPAPQVINVTSFKMAYEVEDKGASGVAKAEVWVTRDDGRTWRQWTVIEKPDSPLVVDLSKHSNPQVEGVYGFKVLLQSGAGLSREAPRGGEAPDLRIDIDVTPPIVKIYEPVPDATQKDTMVLRWQAVDRNLSTDPITLEWADGPKGPWIPIAAADALGSSRGVAKRLANTGSYGWKLPANFPSHKVYLKVSARDVAGNVAEATTSQPILVDLNKPAAVKLNVVGAGN